MVTRFRMAHRSHSRLSCTATASTGTSTHMPPASRVRPSISGGTPDDPSAEVAGVVACLRKRRTDRLGCDAAEALVGRPRRSAAVSEGSEKTQATMSRPRTSSPDTPLAVFLGEQQVRAFAARCLSDDDVRERSNGAATQAQCWGSGEREDGVRTTGGRGRLRGTSREDSRQVC